MFSVKHLFVWLATSLLLSCTTAKKPTLNHGPPAASTRVGNDQDPHGCAPSTGYTWSELQQRCIQVFAAGVRLNPLAAPGTQPVISAFIVFNADKSKVELFLPNGKRTIINQSAPDQYERGAYRFDAKAATLYWNGQPHYQAEK